MSVLRSLCVAVGLLTSSILVGAAEFERGAVPQQGGQLFHASFDHGPRADEGAGFLEMHYAALYRGDQKWAFSFVPGKFGKALDLGEVRQASPEYKAAGREMACFKLHGHACQRVGTLSFWFKSNGRSPLVEFSTQTNDRWRGMEWLNSDGQPGEGKGTRVRIMQRDYSRTPGLLLAPASASDGAWHHVALTWDETTGARAFVDGKPTSDTVEVKPFHNGYLSIGRLSLENVTFDDVRLFDVALEPAQIQAMASGDKAAVAPTTVDPKVLDAHRLDHLAWTDAPADQFIGVAGPTSIRKLNLADARALRMSGWRAVDGREDSVWPLRYHGYEYLEGGGLHLRLEPGDRFNFVRITGRMDSAELCAGDALSRPESPSVIAPLTGERFITAHPLAQPCTSETVSLYASKPKEYYASIFRELRELELLDVQPQPASATDEKPRLRQSLSTTAPQTVAGDNRVRLIGWYRPDERRIIQGTDASPAAAGSVEIRPLRYLHVMTAPAAEDISLSAVRLQLKVDGWKPGNLVNVRVHDPFNLWRSLVDVDLRVDNPADGLDVRLQFPPTLLPADTELWVSLISRDGGQVRCGTDSSISLFGPDLEQAKDSYLTWQHRLLKDTFACFSEPRPWYANTFKDDFLRVALPAYDAIARPVWDLYRRFPEDRRTRGYMLFTHPAEGQYWASLPIDLPQEADVPRWALMQKELLKEFLYFANWWVDNRMVANGELGNYYGDDTDLVQDWISLAMIHDPDGKLRDSLRRLADYVWHNKIRNGLNIVYRDSLHAYEEGLNIQPAAALLDYGNPVLIERLLATARRYDGYLVSPAVDGKRTVLASNFGDEKVEGPPGHEYGALPLHAGMLLTWYNGSPLLTKMLTEVHDGTPSLPPDWMGLMHQLYQIHRDNRFVRSRWPLESDPDWIRIFNAKEIDPAKLEELKKFTLGYDRKLGFANYMPLRKYAVWHFTRDKNALVPALESLWKQTHYTIDLSTQTEQSGDRVAVHKNLTDFMYLGGMPGARNHLVPRFAVSYENFASPEFAAMVIDDTPEQFRWVGYNFERESRTGTLRVWSLAPGKYEVRFGIDADGDDRIDELLETRQMNLKRYEPVAVTLPPRKLLIVEATCIERGRPLDQRGDLAITHEDAQRQGAALDVVVHNLGCAPTGAFRVELLDGSSQRVLTSKEHAGLDGLTDLQPRTTPFHFDGIPQSRPLQVRIVATTDEITESNNQATIAAATPVEDRPR